MIFFKICCRSGGKFLSAVGVGFSEAPVAGASLHAAVRAQASAEGRVAVPQVPAEGGDTHACLEML